ncbi:MAG: HAD-IA family hydrolase [Rhizobiales bacterium]|nr:HAD-IA family hydrolase [Hyphomicrobiales bacterium]
MTISRTLLLFDLDGTLLNSENIILESQRRAFRAIGRPMPDRERALSIVGLSLGEAFQVLVGPDGPHEEAAEHYRQAFHYLRTHEAHLESLFDGVDALLATLIGEPRHVLGIATGKSRRGVDAVKKTYGWESHFVTTQTSDDAPSKPHPGMIENACRETGIASSRTLMIGDSSFDMKMAKAAGVRAIGVSWGFQSVDTLRESGADVIVEDFEALASEIARFA